jgi:hypothetical protein
MRLDFCVASGRRDELEHHHIVPRNMGGSDDVVAGYCRRAERAGHPAARGGQWSSPQVMRVLERMDDGRPFVGVAA